MEGRVARIDANGGRPRIAHLRYKPPGAKPYRRVYCEFPFGDRIERYSHADELTYAAGAYAG